MPPGKDWVYLLLFKYGWLIFIVFQCVNGVSWWQKGKPEMAANHALESGYRRLIRSWIVYGNLPLLIMGVGIQFGGVPTVFHYCNLRNGPFVIAFWVSCVVLWVATFYWMFFQGGAEKLIAHPGLLSLPVARPWAVKTLFLLALTGGVIAMFVVLLTDVPFPNLR